MEKCEIKAYLREAMKWYGAYDVACLLAEAAKDSSLEFLQAGNTGAIIHRDAMALQKVVNDMKQLHILRQG